MNYREVYEQGRSALVAAGIEEAELDARLLLEHICGTTRQELLAHGDRPVEEEAYVRYQEAVKRRMRRIPLQHITGVQEFMGLPFTVNGSVLVPRQDTEILVEEALRYLHDGMELLDMCTGSGCILISLLHYSNGCGGLGADLSDEALETAVRNAERLLGNRADNGARFIKSDLFERVEGSFDMILANPPYIATNVIETLMPEVRDYEPRMALDGGADGLSFYRRLIVQAPRHLKRGGRLFFEIGFDQAEAVASLMRERGFDGIRTVKDFAGGDRVVHGCWHEGERIEE